MRTRRTVTAAAISLLAITGSLVAASTSAVAAETGAEYCRIGITRWTYSTYTMHVRSNVPASFNSSVTSAMRQWNGISGSALSYAGPQFNSGVANPEFLFYYNNFASSGLPDVPGITLGVTGSGTHRTGEVLLNSRFTWNTAGTMNQAQRRTDVWTIAVHEIGHASGLAHPYPDPCGTVTTAERASVMYVDWTRKRNTNSDDKAGIAAIY